jgi:hypothetical protein
VVEFEIEEEIRMGLIHSLGMYVYTEVMRCVNNTLYYELRVWIWMKEGFPRFSFSFSFSFSISILKRGLPLPSLFLCL